MLVAKKLIYYSLESMISLSKTQLKLILNELKLPHSADALKYNSIKRSCNVIVKEANKASEHMISAIEDEDADENVV